MRRYEFAFQRKFDPNQPRDEIGRWTDGGTGWNSGGDADELLHLASDLSWGTLFADFETSTRRRCIYQFDFGTIYMDGPTHRCQPKILSSAATHGFFLNDN